MTRLSNWEIPPKIWSILAVWGIGVVLITGLLSWWIASNEHQAAAERVQIQIGQDRAMCAMLSLFLSGPEPVPGPAGERSRVVRKAMTDYRDTLRCSEIQPPVIPGPARSGKRAGEGSAPS